MIQLYYSLFLKSTSKLWIRPVWLCLLLMGFAFSAVAQQERTITGVVIDNTQQSLPGVTVVAKSTGKGTSTDLNGKYSLKVSGPADSVRFSIIGFAPQTYLVGSRGTINVTLAQDQRQLKDVVVIGYGTASKQEVTGSITSIKSEEFNPGVLVTPAELLQGKVAGLNVTKSGDPNQRPNVILRGPSSLKSNDTGEPFYVIDGVPGASIDLLAPADIESIDVLKDASSTAIYGSRAANGVIIVTTKRAKLGQSRLSYSTYVGMDRVSKKIDMISGDELRQYIRSNNLTPLAMPLNDDGSNTNWQNLIERTGYSQNHNLSYNGSGKTSDYGASVNYFKNNGILKRTSLERIIYRGYVNQRFFNDRLKLGLNLTNSTSKRNDIYKNNILPAMLFYLPTVSPYNPDGSYKENYTRTGNGTLNPLSLLYNNTIQGDNNKILINGLAQLDILKGLQFTLSYSNQRDQDNAGYYQTSNSGLVVGSGGVARRTSYLNATNILETYFNYDKVFGRHNLKLLAGYSYQQNRTNDGFGVRTQRFSNDNLSYYNLYLSNPASNAEIGFDNAPISRLRLISFYGRVQYQFNNRYLLQASLRNDGSSAYGINNRWGLFPAVSGAWRITEENFMQKLPVVSDLKLRVGYGVSGNSQGFDAFSSLLIYGTPPAGSKFLSNGNITNAIGPVRNDNPDLKWESTSTTNLGLDFGLFKNRITGAVDYYIKHTYDLIYENYPVSLTQYFVNTITANVGKIKNSGIEVLLSAVAVRTTDFSWKTSVNFSHNRNIVQSLSNDQFNLPNFNTAFLGGKGQTNIPSQIVIPGYPVGTFNLWRYAGKNAAGGSTFITASGAVTDRQPTTADQYIAGNAQPDLIYGWTNTFTYRNFDLNFLIRGVRGNKVLNATLATLNNPADAVLQNIPRFTLSESPKDGIAYLVSDRYLESGSYLRLDNATLGYTVRPSRVPAIKAVRLYFTASNLFLITKYKGLDPEVNIGGTTPGIDNNNYYPRTRSFILGLNASF